MSILDVVVGAQFGSEGKGHVTAQLILRHLNRRPVINIRVAGPNAGHCVVDNAGRKYALRSVPVGGAIDPTHTGGHDVTCYIAPGSEIEPAVLFQEIAELRQGGHTPKILIHEEATVLEETHKASEAKADLTGRVGSTGKGIGAARASRLMREASRVKDQPGLLHALGIAGVEVVGDEWLRAQATENVAIVIEGTQGYGLGLHAGHYPQCTSSDTRAVDFLAMAGITPWYRGVNEFRIWAVARVYPIRVAGNSGPLQGETTWDELGLAPEKTTVTQKIRRVGQWDADLIREAVAANGGRVAVSVALTMVDQKIPGLEASEDASTLPEDVRHELRDLISQVEDDADAWVEMVTTSDRTAIFV